MLDDMKALTAIDGPQITSGAKNQMLEYQATESFAVCFCAGLKRQ